MLPAIASIISSAASAGGGLMGNILTNRANKKMAEYSYSKDLEMWNRQNAYNDPQAQMLRLKKAGLNPNMIYGTGAASAVGNSSQMPKYNVPTQKYDNYLEKVDIPAILSQSSNLKEQSARTQNIQAQTAKTNQETLTEAINTTLKGTSAKQAALDLRKGTQTEKYFVSKQASEAKNAALRAQNMEKILKMTDQQVMNLAAQHDKITAETQTAYAKTLNIDADTLNKRADYAFKTYENALRKIGVNSSDNVLLRMIVRGASNAFGENWLENLGQWITNGKHIYADPTQIKK